MILLFLENFFISLSAVFANKTRSILTALGIIIGVVSVTMMGTLISGLDKTFESSMSWLGKDILYVSRYEWFGDMEWWEVRNRPRIRPEYVDKVKERSKYALAVAPVMQRGANLSRDEKKRRNANTPPEPATNSQTPTRITIIKYQNQFGPFLISTLVASCFYGFFA